VVGLHRKQDSLNLQLFAKCRQVATAPRSKSSHATAP
jgi:hypothetical protein